MEIRSVSVGVVAIKSVSTGLYLAMSKKGTLFGSVRIQPGNIFLEVKTSGQGRKVVGVAGYIWVPNECHPMFDVPEERENLRNLLMESSERYQTVIINHGCTPAPCLTIQKLELACSTIKTDSRKKKPKQQWQIASLVHVSPCVPSANCCFVKQLSKVITTHC